MGMFITGRVAITATGPIAEHDITPQLDVIFIHPKMPVGVRNKVLGEAAKIELARAPVSPRGKRAAQKRADKQDANVNFDVGAYNIALLTNNILGWQGPSFAGVPCTPANIVLLDQDQPLVQRVLQEINDRNTQATPDDEEPAEGDDPNVIELPATASTPGGGKS